MLNCQPKRRTFSKENERVRWIADSTDTENHKQVSAEKVQESCRVSAQLETGTPNLPGNAFFPSFQPGETKFTQMELKDYNSPY